MGNTFALLVGTGAVLTAVILLIKRPLLYAFGASDATYPYADGYITIYLLGSVFVMVSLGMNQFINAQGFGRKGMMTVLIGAVTNIVLDPLFIFVFDMGVQGAALATIISQFLSALWAFSFLRGKKALIRLEWPLLKAAPAAGVADSLPWAFPALSWPLPTPLCRWPAIPPCKPLAATCMWE